MASDDDQEPGSTPEALSARRAAATPSWYNGDAGRGEAQEDDDVALFDDDMDADDVSRKRSQPHDAAPPAEAEVAPPAAEAKRTKVDVKRASSTAEAVSFDAWSCGHAPVMDFGQVDDATRAELQRQGDAILIALNEDADVEKDVIETYPFLKNVRDAKKRPRDDPNYDPTTLFIPDSDFAKLTDVRKQYWAIKVDWLRWL